MYYWDALCIIGTASYLDVKLFINLFNIQLKF
jgi:hypothetical protein